MRDPMTRLLGVAVAAASLFAADAQACALSPNIVTPAAPSTTYNVFDPAPTVRDVSVTLTNTAPTQCLVRLAAQSFNGASPQFGMAGASALLAYELLAPGGVPIESSSSPLDGLAITVPANGSAAVTLRIRIASGQVVSPGVYQDSMQLRTFDASSLALLQSQAVTAIASVAPQAQVAVVGTGPGDTVDFGDLLEGKTLGIQVYLRGNTNMSVTFISANRSTLRHESLVSARPIPYTAAFGGSTLNLSGGSAEVVRSLASINAAGGQFPMVFTIGSTAGSAAGRYTDTMMLVVLPNP